MYKGSGASTSAIARFYPSDFVVTHDRRRITYRAHLDLRAEADLIREKVFISCVNCADEECEGQGAELGVS